jgi:hypothetical protein
MGCFAPLIQSSYKSLFFLFIEITLIVFKKTIRSLKYYSFFFFSFIFELLWIIVFSDVTLELTPKATADTNVFILKPLF